MWVIMYTPPIAEILCVKNGMAIVVCGFFYNEIIFKRYAERLKKIVGADWELPAKKHSQSSQTWVEMSWIGCAI